MILNSEFNTPILLLVFNRPRETKFVFEHIRAIRAPKLFIACDGPREGNDDDVKDIAEVMSIVKNIDWECECKYLFRDKNLGCGKAVLGAFTWFFSEVERGIILEDDCIPNLSFFKFCQEMLFRYENNDSIMVISGTNIMSDFVSTSDYAYSSFPIMWGWATWKKAWEKFDLEMKDWPSVTKNTNLITHGIYKWRKHPVFIEYFMNTYKKVNQKDLAWDHQWIFSNWLNNGLTVVSSKNLIHNIGFGEKSNSTKEDNLNRENLGSYFSYPPYVSPKTIAVNEELDLYISKKWFQATWFYYFKIILLRIKFIKKTWFLIKEINKKWRHQA